MDKNQMNFVSDLIEDLLARNSEKADDYKKDDIQIREAIGDFLGYFNLEELLRKTHNVSLLELFSSVDDDHLLEDIAKNRNTPEEILHKLAKTKHYHVELEVSHNPATSLSTLKYLAKYGQGDDTKENAKHQIDLKR